MSETPIDTYQTQKYKDITEGNRRKRENPINHLFPFDVSLQIHYKCEERTLGEGKTTDRVFLSVFLSRCEKRNGVHAEKSRNKIQEQTQLKFSSGSKHCRRTLVSHQVFFLICHSQRITDLEILNSYLRNHAVLLFVWLFSLEQKSLTQTLSWYPSPVNFTSGDTLLSASCLLLSFRVIFTS